MMHIEQQQMPHIRQLYQLDAQKRRLSQIEWPNEVLKDLLKLILFGIAERQREVNLWANDLNGLAIYEIKTCTKDFMTCRQFL
ncbi:Uncharacterised protein [Paenibacillus thiaminolyticus]|nr:Uncharacterised protein [Paenibacillus thiaminolyticus]